MSAVVSTRCSRCGAELRDRTSRLIGIGPECRKTMTTAQLRAAMARNTPGHIPTAAPRPASATARRNHTELQRVTAPTPQTKRCVHEDDPRSCALCRRDNDPWRAAERIITERQRLTRDERLDAERAAALRLLRRAYTPPAPPPPAPPRPAPAAPAVRDARPTPAPAPAGQGELFDVAS